MYVCMYVCTYIQCTHLARCISSTGFFKSLKRRVWAIFSFFFFRSHSQASHNHSKSFVGNERALSGTIESEGWLCSSDLSWRDRLRAVGSRQRQSTQLFSIDGGTEAAQMVIQTQRRHADARQATHRYLPGGHPNRCSALSGRLISGPGT